MEVTLSLTYENLDRLMNCLSVTKKLYPISWNKSDEEAYEKIRKAYLTAFEKRKENFK